MVENVFRWIFGTGFNGQGQPEKVSWNKDQGQPIRKLYVLIVFFNFIFINSIFKRSRRVPFVSFWQRLIDPNDLKLGKTLKSNKWMTLIWVSAPVKTFLAWNIVNNSQFSAFRGVQILHFEILWEIGSSDLFEFWYAFKH